MKKLTLLAFFLYANFSFCLASRADSNIKKEVLDESSKVDYGDIKLDASKKDFSGFDVYIKALDIKQIDDRIIREKFVSDYKDIVDSVDFSGKIEESPEAVRKLIKFYKKYKNGYPVGALREYFYSRLEIKSGCKSPKWNDTVLSEFTSANGVNYHLFNASSIPKFFSYHAINNSSIFEKENINRFYSFFFCLSYELCQTGENTFIDSLKTKGGGRERAIRYFKEKIGESIMKFRKLPSGESPKEKVSEFRSRIRKMDFLIDPILRARNEKKNISFDFSKAEELKKVIKDAGCNHPQLETKN